MIGNSRVGALIDTQADIVWMCVPRFDGDPVFCSLLSSAGGRGRFSIELDGCASIQQAYLRNTPVLRTVMTDDRGGSLELIDFAPRFYQFGRMFAPVTVVRIRPNTIRRNPFAEPGSGIEYATIAECHGRERHMINKIVDSVAAAVAGIQDGATILIGGFGTAGMPSALIDALIEQGARDLTIVNNNAGNGDTGLAALLKAERVRKIVCSFPRQTDSWVFDGLYRAGKLELELVPQGNLAERIRAAGAGIGAFFTPTGYGTLLAEGKETRLIDGRGYVLEYPIRADVALIKALRGDRWGNLVYRKAARNFGPIMATAAKCTIAQVEETVALGVLDPEAIVTPGIFVQRVVAVRAQQSAPGSAQQAA